MNFEELNLSPAMMSGLKDVKKDKPTELQQAVLPAILEKKDVLIKAEDGSDKNGVIGISALQKFSAIDEPKGTHILILTPNPKEATEIDELIWAMGYHAQVECAAIHLDGNQEEQQKSIESGVPILVANPGRLLDILEENKFIFRHVDCMIIDSMDQMVSIGLVDKLKAINKRVMSDCQNVLISNELNKEVTSFAKYFLDEPEVIGFETGGPDGEAGAPPEVPQDLTQHYINVPPRMKITTLMAHLENTPDDRCVVFTASKRGTDRLYRVFRKRNLKATSLHGKLSDEKHAQRFANFSNGDVQYLLVADISAGELDLDKITQVINYDVPNDSDEYRYRANLVGSGKAARMVSLVSKQDRSDIKELENELGQSPEEIPLPDKVNEKLKQRKNKQSNKKKERPKRGGNNKGQNKGNKMELPRPSYDKLSGGRSGDADERTGVVEFFKKLFS
ncbi:MAG: DEAD/DEAH box helicase [Balneolaceae bacterium]|nr:DEAD/DEAH box helicase [Balneolaceae bacterium]